TLGELRSTTGAGGAGGGIGLLAQPATTHENSSGSQIRRGNLLSDILRARVQVVRASLASNSRAVVGTVVLLELAITEGDCERVTVTRTLNAAAAETGAAANNVPATNPVLAE